MMRHRRRRTRPDGYGFHHRSSQRHGNPGSAL